MIIKGLSIIYLFPKYVKSIRVINNTVLIVNIDKKNITILGYILKNSRYMFNNTLLDIWITDIREFNTVFEVTYKITFNKDSFSIYFRLALNSISPICQSLTSIYPSAAWLERECWDLFGISLTNHTDLRRLLTDYGFDGYPSRKDSPLSGYTEVGYSERYKRVIIEPLNLMQEYRLFDFKTPWESIV